MAPPATSKKKWFAVAITATRISSGYASPKPTHSIRRKLSKPRPLVLSGNLMMVRPIKSAYPKCRLGMADHWLQNSLVVQILPPSLPVRCTVSWNPKALAFSPLGPVTIVSLSKHSGMSGHVVKTIRRPNWLSGGYGGELGKVQYLLGFG